MNSRTASHGARRRWEAKWHDEAGASSSKLDRHVEQALAGVQLEISEQVQTGQDFNKKAKTMESAVKEAVERLNARERDLEAGSQRQLDDAMKKLTEAYKEVEEMRKRELELHKTLKDLDLDWVLGVDKAGKSRQPPTSSFRN